MGDGERWEIGGSGSGMGVVELDCARIMAVVNVTPDSFSDGGRLGSVEEAVEYGLECLDGGADVLDIGGESTRPGAGRVEAGEQIRRVVPVVEGVIEKRGDAIVSVDTTSGEVARAAVRAGARIVNDVSAGMEDAGIFEVASEYGTGLVLMHRLRPPEGDVFSNRYGAGDEPRYATEDGGVVGVVTGFLRDRAVAAAEAGVGRGKMVVDPGLGFGKTVEQNIELIRNMGAMGRRLGVPILSAASRKSFVGAISGVDEASDRVFGTLGVSASHYLDGVRLFRVHDVRAHVELFSVLRCIGSVGG